MAKQVHDQAAELRMLQQEVNGLLKDLRRERRAVALLVSGVREQVREEIADQLARGIVGMIAELKKHTERATARVFRRFDTISDVMLGTPNKPGARPPLEDMAAAWLRGQPPEVQEETARRIRSNLDREQRRLDHLAEHGGSEDEYMGADGKATFPEETPQGRTRGKNEGRASAEFVTAQADVYVDET